MVLTTFPGSSASATAQQGDQQYEQTLDLDIRVVEYPRVTRKRGGSDYLTCKTDSTCDNSDAC